MGPVSLDTVSGSGLGSRADGGVIMKQASATAALSPVAANETLSTAGIATTAVAVQAQVDALLTSLGDPVASDQQLRMIIALLILNALLGKDDDQAMNKAAELAGLMTGLDIFGRQARYAIFSATNIIQIQHQSTLVYSDQAIQTITEGQAGGQDSSGSRLDLTA